MQNVDNHMDDLFRKAADNYPLNTSNGDWDRLQVFLEKEQSTSRQNVSKRKLIFYFVSFGFVLFGLMDAVILKNKGVAIRTAKTLSAIDHSALKLAENAPNKSTEKISNPALAAKKYELKEGQQKMSSIKPKTNQITIHSFFAHAKSINHQPTIADNTINQKTIPETASKTVQSNERNPFKALDSIRVKEVDSASVKADVTNKIDTVFNENKKAANNTLNRKSRSKIYFSISTGFEYGQVKRQGFTKPGLNAGLFAGLQFNNRISIEAGLQLSQKKYFSSGLYFKPKSGSMPSDMVVTSLNGNSTLIELPVNLKYNLQKMNNTFYIMAGISSFIMTSESNHYFAVISGAPTQVDGMYHPMHSYLASMLNMSAGYQFALGKKNNLRVEPYLQLPLKGIGIGSMSIMATGLHFVWSRH